MKDKLTPKVVAVIGAVAIAAVALLGWFGVVSPQRSKASDLGSRIADAKVQLAVVQATARPHSGGAKGPAASARELARAMPREAAMPTVLRQLLRASRQSGVRLDSVAPQAATAVAPAYSTLPMQVVVTGRYFPIQSFLKRLRTQAGVVDSRVHASGRLFSVDAVSLAASPAQLPQLAATIQMSVFTYSGSTAPASPAAPATSAAPPISSSATAAGRTP